MIGGPSPIKSSADALPVTENDGIIEDTFSYDDAIKEEVHIQTGVDSDKDGKEDSIYVEIERPKETNEDVQVPVIYNVSPYNGGLPYPEYHDVDQELYGGFPAPAPTIGEHYAPYFVPKGYAVVTVNSIGSEGSDGCPSTGGEDEIQAAKSVIDWLNGRAVAFDEDGDKVDADWSTGNVGMIGKSYDGTLANGVATTGVDGLKTIVPIAGISNWYDYYRSNGAVIAPGGYQGDDADRLARGVLTRENPEVCEPLMDEIEIQQDRVTGDYNEFWDERNYLKNVDKIEASVFLIHGLQDVNVQPSQSTNLWELLKKHDIPRKMWLHQGEHVDPVDVRGDEWMTALNKWFAYWLYDIDNDVMDTPIVDLEHPDHTWEQLDEWPRTDANDKTLYLASDNGENDTTLSIEENQSSENNQETFTDDATIEVEDLIKNPMEKSENRLAYLSPVLSESMHLSGVPELSIKAGFDEPTANLSAVLVDYSSEENKVVTRGWIDPKNKDSLSESINLDTDETYTFTWDMEAYEHEFEKGHQIGLVIISSDNEYTKRPDPGTEITIYPEESKIILPLTGDFKEEASQSDNAQTSNTDKSTKRTLSVVVFGFIAIIAVFSWILYRIKRQNK